MSGGLLLESLLIFGLFFPLELPASEPLVDVEGRGEEEEEEEVKGSEGGERVIQSLDQSVGSSGGELPTGPLCLQLVCILFLKPSIHDATCCMQQNCIVCVGNVVCCMQRDTVASE